MKNCLTGFGYEDHVTAGILSGMISGLAFDFMIV